jgi:hypothetical protein
MIADHETNVVYVADTLERRFPTVHDGLKLILEQYGIPFRIIPGTRDIWCRDYMPIQVSENRFVQFKYAPDYLIVSKNVRVRDRESRTSGHDLWCAQAVALASRTRRCLGSGRERPSLSRASR